MDLVRSLFSKYLLILLLNAWAMNTQSFAEDKIRIPVIVYYDYLPYYDADSDQNLNVELVKFLNKKVKGIDFYSEYIPKGRLDKWINKPNWRGLVTWVNPKFVSDEEKVKFDWSDALFEEKDWVVSHQKKPINFNGVESLQGLTLGTVLNQRYADVEALLDSGKIKRQNVFDQEANIKMLMSSKIDVAFISRSTIDYFRSKIENFPSGLYFASTPRNQFSRHVMLTKAIDNSTRKEILKIINSMKDDKEWKERFLALESERMINSTANKAP